jgi:type VI secretion system secreted protein VgrG
VEFSQQDRPFRAKTFLGTTDLLLESFTGIEAVSRPFRFILKLASEKSSIDLKAGLRTPVTVTMVLPENRKRFVHGHISRFTQFGIGTDGLVAYEAEVVPWLSFLDLYHNCRIFQKKTARQIVETIFQDRELKNFRFDVQAALPEREYCVQYRESDLNFVSRLMEEEGIFYFFEHDEDKHTLVLTDKKSAIQPCPDQETASYHPITGGQMAEDSVYSLELLRQVHSGSTALADYNFETPKVSLSVSVAGEQKGEIYDYPGRYSRKNEGDRYAKIRVEEQEAAFHVVRGTSNCRAFRSGFRFTLKECYRDDANQAYSLLSVEHSGRNPSYRGDQEAEPFYYVNRFEAIPSPVQYRPPRLAHKGVVRGSQTAVVVGPAAEEIYVDNHGRVKVQFFWDREGQHNQDSSCWIRVSQAWAGKGWGAMIIPRIGQEVIVEFLEGDPDRPVIIGRVYNADQVPPYSLPDNKTQSGILSRSSKGGSAATCNEIRMEDLKGQELLYIHAEKDETHEIEHDRKRDVGNDEKITVGHDRSATVTNDETVKVGNNRTATVGKDETITVANNQSATVGLNRDASVGQNDSVTAGQKIELTAGMEIKLTAAGSSITLGPAGITIQGVIVKIN